MIKAWLERGVNAALAVENDGVEAPVETVVAGVVDLDPPGRLIPASGSLAALLVAVAGFGVNGCGLDAPVAATLTICNIEPGIAKPPVGAPDGGAMVAGSPNPDAPDDGVAVGAGNVLDGNAYPVAIVDPLCGEPGAGYDEGIA